MGGGRGRGPVSSEGGGAEARRMRAHSLQLAPRATGRAAGPRCSGKRGGPCVPQTVGAGATNGKAGPFVGLRFSGWKGEGLLVPGQAWGSCWPDAR